MALSKNSLMYDSILGICLANRRVKIVISLFDISKKPFPNDFLYLNFSSLNKFNF